MNSLRLLTFIGGICGALGVALSAIAAHQPELPNLGTASSMLMFHAPAFLALSLMATNKVRLVGSWTLAAGLAMFAGDLLSRAYLGARLFPMAAPTGGTLMIAGWLVIAASAFVKPNAEKTNS